MPWQLLKSKDITLPAKVHIVKAMVFPVVMYGCESQTIKKTVQQGKRKKPQNPNPAMSQASDTHGNQVR